MKVQIEPKVIGGPATRVNYRIVNDDGESEAFVYWEAFREDNSRAGEGNLVIKGEDYANWPSGTNAECNAWLKQWVLDKLGVAEAVPETEAPSA